MRSAVELAGCRRLRDNAHLIQVTPFIQCTLTLFPVAVETTVDLFQHMSAFCETAQSCIVLNTIYVRFTVVS